MSSGPSAREIKVKAWFFLPIETDEDNLRRIQRRLKLSLRQNGFYQTDEDLMPFGPAERTMDFYRLEQISEPELPLWTRLKSSLGLDISKERRKLASDEALKSLERLRNDLPYRLVFHFKTVQTEDGGGYDVRVESTPALLQKYRQLDVPDDYKYNIDDVVQENKDEIEKIAGGFGVEPYRGPLTDAEVLDPLLTDQEQDVLKKHRYGRTVLGYINQGDRCLQENMLHAALNCYIHAIEWTIIHYKNLEEDTNLIEEQKNENKYFTYANLVAKIRNGTPVSRITLETLEKFNSAERRWTAHHREGDIPRTNVENVRESLGKLVQEIFREVI